MLACGEVFIRALTSTVPQSANSLLQGSASAFVPALLELVKVRPGAQLGGHCGAEVFLGLWHAWRAVVWRGTHRKQAHAGRNEGKKSSRHRFGRMRVCILFNAYTVKGFPAIVVPPPVREDLLKSFCTGGCEMLHVRGVCLKPTETMLICAHVTHHAGNASKGLPLFHLSNVELSRTTRGTVSTPFRMLCLAIFRSPSALHVCATNKVISDFRGPNTQNEKKDVCDQRKNFASDMHAIRALPHSRPAA